MVALIQVPTSSTEPQWFYTRAELDRSPSVRAGMSLRDEREMRQKAIHAVWQLKDGVELKQAAVSTAITLLYRFYMRETFQKFDYLAAAGAAVFLASKSEEEPKSIKRITQILYDIRRGKYRRETVNQRPPQTGNGEFLDLRKTITIVEEAMLSGLSFDLTLRLPQYVAQQAAERIWRREEEAVWKEIAQVAWSFVNDSYSAPLCLLHRAHLIAAAALVLACAQLSIPLPAPPLTIDEQRTLHAMDAEEGEESAPFEPDVPWLEVLDVEEEELKVAVDDILDCYKFAVDDFVSKEAVILSNKAHSLLQTLNQR